MSEPLWDRFKVWLCGVVGHLGLMKDKLWKHDGKIHTDCKFCRRTYSVKEDGK